VPYSDSESSQSQPDNDEVLDEPMPLVPYPNSPLVPYSDSEDSQDIVQHGGGHQEQGEPSRKRPRLDDPSNRQRDTPLPLPIREYYDLEGPVTKRVKLFRIKGLAYTIKFKNYEKMVDLERILIGIFGQVRMFNNFLVSFTIML
jgi:hypothetical protein